MATAAIIISCISIAQNIGLVIWQRRLNRKIDQL